MREKLGALIDDMLNKGIELPVATREFEQLYIQMALLRTDGNITRAADFLGVHRNTLRSKISVGRKSARKARPRRRP